MRRLLLAAFIAVVAQGAHAADPADLPVLRGAFREPAPAVSYRTIWQGFYVGGQAGYGASNMAFSAYNQDLINQLVSNPIATQGLAIPNWPTPLNSASHRASSFGAFAGYNAQYENVVLGFEANYMRGTFTGAVSGRNDLRVQETPTLIINSTLSSASMQVTDFGSVRVRGGYTIDSFMPYLFAGVGMGLADTTQSVAILQNGALVSPSSRLSTDTKKNFVYGFALGAGVDWMLFRGLFLRAEYEYLQYTSSINTNIQTGRVGVGYKF